MSCSAGDGRERAPRCGRARARRTRTCRWGRARSRSETFMRRCELRDRRERVTRASSANASSKRQSARSGSSISFEITRSSSAGTPSSRQAESTAKPLHRLDGDAARAAHARARADRQRERLGQCAPRRGEQPSRRARSARCRRRSRPPAVPITVASSGMPLPRRAPAMPTCSTAVGAALGDGVLGRGVGRARDRCRRPACGAPAAPASSCGVAAITSSTRAL